MPQFRNTKRPRGKGDRARLAGEAGIDVHSCVDAIGRKLYGISLAARGIRCGNNVVA